MEDPVRNALKTNGERAGGSIRNTRVNTTPASKERLTLSGAAKMWPTPQAHDSVKGNPSRVGRYGTKHGGRNLNDWVAKWPTPHANCHTGPGSSGRDGGENLQTAAGGALNPPWVEWLMGWPIGATDLKPLEMESFRQWLEKHGCD